MISYEHDWRMEKSKKFVEVFRSRGPTKFVAMENEICCCSHLYMPNFHRHSVKMLVQIEQSSKSHISYRCCDLMTAQA